MLLTPFPHNVLSAPWEPDRVRQAGATESSRVARLEQVARRQGPRAAGWEHRWTLKDPEQGGFWEQ